MEEKKLRNGVHFPDSLVREGKEEKRKKKKNTRKTSPNE